MRKLMISVAAILLVACRTHAAEPAKVEPVVAKPAAVEPAAAAPKEDGLQVIILGGGKEAAEAEAWKKRWLHARPVYDDLVKLAKGYPRVVRSDELPGLNTGYEIAILGVCKHSDAAAPLAMIKSVYPGAYTKEIAGEQPEACPVLPTQAKLHSTKTLKNDGWRLTVNVYLRQPRPVEDVYERREPPDPQSGFLEVVAALFDAEDNEEMYERSTLYESMPDLLASPSSCELNTESSKERIVVRATCDKQVEPCSGKIARLVEKVSFGIRENELEHKTVVVEKREAPLCD